MSERSKVNPDPTEPARRVGLDGFIDRASWLDGPGEMVAGIVLGLYGALGGPGRALKSLMHGTRPLGHPLHAALSDVPLGAFTVMFLADWVAIFTRAVPLQVGSFALIIGVVGMLAAMAAGYTDYTGTAGKERRYATVHSLTMQTVLVAMIASLILRYQPVPYMVGVLISTLAFFLVLFGAFLGGHLTFAFGTMVNHNAFSSGVNDWTSVGAAQDYSEGKLVRVMAGDMPVMLVRRSRRLSAIGAVCSHAGGPLDEGELDGDVVICPWHQSRFCVTDGKVKDGPATFDQPAFLVREQGGRVEVKLPAPLH